jgi:hypothetical protein
MPPTKRKIRLSPGGPEKDAQLLDIQQSNEYWNQYLLGDGTVIKLKLVATEVWRIEGEYDQDGNPIYVVKSSNVLTVNPPEELTRKP